MQPDDNLNDLEDMEKMSLVPLSQLLNSGENFGKSQRFRNMGGVHSLFNGWLGDASQPAWSIVQEN